MAKLLISETRKNKKEINDRFYNLFKRKYGSRKINLAELSQATGIGRTTLQMKLREKNSPSLSDALLILEALDIPFSQLTDGLFNNILED